MLVTGTVPCPLRGFTHRPAPRSHPGLQHKPVRDRVTRSCVMWVPRAGATAGRGDPGRWPCPGCSSSSPRPQSHHRKGPQPHRCKDKLPLGNYTSPLTDTAKWDAVKCLHSAVPLLTPVLLFLRSLTAAFLQLSSHPRLCASREIPPAPRLRLGYKNLSAC